MGRSSGRIQDVSFYKEPLGIDGEAIEFEWNISPRFSSLAISSRDPKDLARKNIKPEESKDWIIFMSMFNDIDWSERKNDENFKDAGRFKVLGRKRSGMGNLLTL